METWYFLFSNRKKFTIRKSCVSFSVLGEDKQAKVGVERVGGGVYAAFDLVYAILKILTYPKKGDTFLFEKIWFPAKKFR